MLYNILVRTHSGLRWVVLALLVAAVISAFLKWQRRDEYTSSDNRLYLFAFISTHIQLTLGLILYFISPKVNFGMVSDKLYRFFTIEHLVGMLIAVVLITIGRGRSRRAPGPINKHKTVFIFYLIGLLIILASIPWPFRNLGAGWY